MITDEMVLAAAKAVSPIAWEMVDGKYIVSDITREETLDVVRRILTAALTPAVGDVERHAECPCEDDKCIFPKCICALPSTSPAVGGGAKLSADYWEKVAKGYHDSLVKAEMHIAELEAATPAVGGEREALEKILQRLRGPASAVISDVRKIVQDALAAKSVAYCTCPCSCDETPHDGKPCLIHDAATPAVGGEPVEWHWRTLDDEGKPTSLWFVVDGSLEKFKKDMQDDRCEYRPLYAAQPASPLRGRGDLPEFEDPRVQIVYELLCENTEPPNPEEHWEGWRARNIIAALSASPPEQPAADGLARYWEGRWRDEKAENEWLRAQPAALLRDRAKLIDLADRIDVAKQSWNRVEFECTESEKDLLVTILRASPPDEETP